MRQTFVVGNWKMNGSLQENTALLTEVKQGLNSAWTTQIAVCPPFVYLAQVSELLANTTITWGAQNAAQAAHGAFTGEVSAPMLKEFGCKYVILGHSERRHIYNETNEQVAEKFAQVQNVGLTPILCVGELLSERETEQTEQVIQQQLDAVLNAHGIAAITNALIAYEPVWAIGTGKTATPEQAQAVHQFIRQQLAQADADIAEKTTILYGGSVKPNNATDLFAMPDVDGGLIGGAALKAKDFLAICQAAG